MGGPVPKTLEELVSGLPGADVVIIGLQQLREQIPGPYGLLVLVAARRLSALGIDVPCRNDVPRPVEHQLYAMLEEADLEAAYGQYNALMRTLASFIHAFEQRSAAEIPS